MPAKMATLGFLKIKVFWNNGYEVIIFVPNITNKVLSRDLSYIIEVVMWPKFGNSNISMREVIVISISLGFDQKKQFFEEWSWFKFNSLGLALSLNSKFFISVAKGLKLKVRNPTFAELTGEKLVGLKLDSHPPRIALFTSMKII